MVHFLLLFMINSLYSVHYLAVDSACLLWHVIDRVEEDLDVALDPIFGLTGHKKRLMLLPHSLERLLGAGLDHVWRERLLITLVVRGRPRSVTCLGDLWIQGSVVVDGGVSDRVCPISARQRRTIVWISSACIDVAFGSGRGGPPRDTTS